MRNKSYLGRKYVFEDKYYTINNLVIKLKKNNTAKQPTESNCNKNKQYFYK